MDGSLILDAVVESLDSAMFVVTAIKVLADFFDLDVKWEDAGLGDVSTIAQLLKVKAINTKKNANSELDL
eukprot:CAMPEP_0171465942 /NCGR_PEP_ID=MMETSP0945-20130129/8880_1 /TAXON_ID=109269 /ORGANISM="Vaucheria litorea, Strain CCMP2940" /LENGTH=69 /DNA_ID=CAMNT_0011993773 /DNA_START=389 /DNA_END=598 /DNA_ORIENTATION=-